MQKILDGESPDVPPHWELVYQIEDEVFGIDRPGPIERGGIADSAVEDREIRLNIELMSRMVDTYGWAAVYPVAFSLKSIGEIKRELGGEALVAAYEWDGVFWMPPGDKFVDFTVMLFEKPKELHEAGQREVRSREGVVETVGGCRG